MVLPKLFAIAVVTIIAIFSAGGSSWGRGPLTGETGQTVNGGSLNSHFLLASAYSLSAEEERAVKLLNSDRAAHGLEPLAVNPALAAVAGRHAQDMIDHKFFSHTNPAGESPKDRVSRSGASFGYVGENLAMDATVEAAEAALMRSLAHRANILSPRYTEVGIGVREGSDGEVYMVQVFIGPGSAL